MKPCYTKYTIPLIACSLGAFALSSRAQIVQNNQTDFTSSTAFVGSIGVNLIQAGQSSLASVTD